MRKQLLLLCGIAFGSAFLSAPAQAQALNFTLTGSRTATFTLPSSTPSSFSTSTLIGDQIFFNAVAGTFGGTAGVADISFGTGSISDLQIQSSTLLQTQLFGPINLFGGDPANPTFNLGTFDLSGGFTAGPAVLTISSVAGTGGSGGSVGPVVSAVPEPGTWGMMLVGFGAIGFASRRRRATLAFRRA